MGDNCNKNEEILIDAYYGEIEISHELAEHLKTCHRCIQFKENLNMIQSKFSVLDHITINDVNIIQDIFANMDVKSVERRELLDFIAFICIATLVIGAIIIAAFKGFIAFILILQCVGYSSPLFIMPLIIKHRLVKEECS